MDGRPKVVLFSSVDQVHKFIIFLSLSTGERGAKGDKGDTGIGQRGEIGPPGIPGVFIQNTYKIHHSKPLQGHRSLPY